MSDQIKRKNKNIHRTVENADAVKYSVECFFNLLHIPKMPMEITTYIKSFALRAVIL